MTALYKLHAPICAMPNCANQVRYHKTFTKQDKTMGFKFKTFCEFHRSVKGSAQRDAFLQSKGGCENRDGRLGITCKDPSTPSLTLDHWDRNRHNNDQDNLVVLCANCHNYKSKKYKDTTTRYTYTTPMFSKFF